jgi:hypothetical protein
MLKTLAVSKQQDFKASQGWIVRVFGLEKDITLSEWQKKRRKNRTWQVETCNIIMTESQGTVFNMYTLIIE